MYILSSIDKNSNIDSIEINTTISIGRGNDNDVIINNQTISTQHARILYNKNGDIYIEDLNSSNGTFLDGTKIKAGNSYQLYDNQIVQFGELSFAVKKVKSAHNNKNEIIIGRDPRSDIFIDIDTVSFHHLKVYQENNIWYIEDNLSTNGTYAGSYDNPITKIKLEPDNILFLATYRLSTNEIFDALNNRNKNSNTIEQDITIIGRNPKADIYIDNFNVSWNHAKIVKEGSSYYIYDLDSTNGTYVNGISVKNKVEIKPSDRITLGVYSFIFQENKNRNLSIINVNRKGFTIDAKNITFTVNNDKKLLNDISFTVYPGEIVGIMGLSGAGKTTLLKILSGYTSPTEGQVFINGLDLYKNFERVKNTIGYVPQEDVLYPELTVYEALMYSFKLRLKEKLSKEEIDKRINTILKDLALPLDIKNVKIGSPDEKGISGGQRKRVNIAMELLADPEIIFLDEPTSGLSSVDAKIVMEKLKELSERGKTIILTIHQPSLVNYKTMDNLTVLTSGKLAYYGPNYPDSIKYFNSEPYTEEVLNDPDMALIGLFNGETEKNINWQEKYKKSEYYKKFVVDRTGKNKNNNSNFDKNTTPSALKQFTTLISRYFKIKIKDKLNTTILLLQAPVIAILLAFLFNGDGVQFNKEHPSVLLFIIVISAMWFGIINSVKEIVSEKAILERERIIGLKLVPYIMSKFIVLAILSLVQVVLLVGIVKLTIPNFDLSYLRLTTLIFITALSGVSIGLLVSAVAKSVSQALSFVPLVLLPMIIFGGGMMPIVDMPTNKLKLDAYRVSFLMPTRWSLEEAVRIFDNNDTSMPLREPTYDKEHNRLIYSNRKVRVLSLRNDPLCEDKRCIEKLYIKKNPKNDKWIVRTTSTSMIYSILIIFIVLPIVLLLFVLYRRFKK